MKRLAFVLVLPLVAACDDDVNSLRTMPTENDISQANIETICPVDVSEADRANYPACF